MSTPDIVAPQFAEPAVEVERRADGTLVLRSPQTLADYPDHLGISLRHWAETAGERVFLAERAGDGWRQVSFAEARAAADAIAQALLDRGLGPTRPLMILSGNSVNQALLMLGAMQAGIPVAPVSPAYSLMSQDFAKVKHVFDLVRPALLYVEQSAPFAGALGALDLDGVELVAASASTDGPPATPFADLLQAVPGAAFDAAFAAVGPDTIAKYLFTSGSTGLPKGVINTQRMLCANQQQALQIWPFLAEEPPVLVDWLPWNHTFGANHNFNMALVRGGTLYIDAGKPAPGLIEETVRNLGEVSPTFYANVPAGFAALLPYLERDEDLRASLFRRLKLIFYAAAALPQDIWTRLEAVSVAATGHRVAMISAWGSTETAPLATGVHWPIEQAGVIGLPVPGVALKMVPNAGKQELRVKGPNVTPGYLERPDLTAEAFDDEGFYRIGDAGRLLDPADPVRGIVFDGRVAEDFKLTSGTWVHVGGIRVAALAAASPVLQDAVVCGHDRDWIGLLAWPNLDGCRNVAGRPEAELQELIADPAIAAHLQQALAAYNAEHSGSSQRIARVLLMAAPASIDANEITDKGYINQRAVLERRAAEVGRLYAEPAADDVIVID